MPWFKVDDGFWSHPKVLDLSDAAVALWLKAGTYSAQHLTDGAVKSAVVRMVGGTDDAAAELVAAELWDIAEGGYQFHDWLRYQPSAEETREKRAEISAKRSEAGAKGAASRWQTDGKPNGKTNDKRMAPTRPDPTRPVPDQKEEPETLIAAQPRVDLFDQAYNAWPKKVEKADSRKRWAQAVKKHPGGEVGLLEAVRQFGAAYAMHRERQYTPSLASWLNRERWTDELPQPDPVRRGSLTAVEHNMDLYLREKARMEAEGEHPMREIGGVA